jgi:alpha-mannosidase
LNRGEEVPALQWAQVTGQSDGKPAGCLLLNDSKYGHALDGSTLRLTLIRSSYDPDILPEIGQHEIHVALQPLAAELPVTEAIHIGNEFNHALRVIGTDVHEGKLPMNGQFMEVSPDTVILSAIKKGEAGNGLVVRLFNPTEKKVTAKLKFDAKLLGEMTAAQELDLMERPLSESTAKVTGNAVQATVPARGIVSALVRLKR